MVEGKGLGKQNDGRSKPIKYDLKFDKSGIGYKEKNSREENDQWWVRIYDKTASQVASSSSTSNETVLYENETELAVPVLTDEQLFKACGGRTAHRAARFGIKQSGKLSRIMKQEVEKEIASELQIVTVDSEKKKVKRSKPGLSDKKVSHLKSPIDGESNQSDSNQELHYLHKKAGKN